MLQSLTKPCKFLRRFCVDFASIFDSKSWSQTKKLELVLFKLKFPRTPLFTGISDNL